MKHPFNFSIAAKREKSRQDEMQAAELLSFNSSSSSSSSAATETMNLGVSANSSQAERVETNLESLAFDDRLQLDEGDEQEEEEFSFVCLNPDGSPISADDVFHNGQIRPVYPLFNRDLLFVDEDDSEMPDKSPSLRPPLRKLFVEKRDNLAPESESESESESEPEGVVQGTYCEWSPATAETVKKSNSTGFSKLWRFRDLMTMHRSSSDGKDAFVFLSNPTTSTSKSPKNKTHKLQPQPDSRTSTSTSTSAPKLYRHKPRTAPSAHETHYVRSRAQQQVDKRKSYLPYRQDLVGFFTSVNGFSKNVHPF